VWPVTVSNQFQLHHDHLLATTWLPGLTLWQASSRFHNTSCPVIDMSPMVASGCRSVRAWCDT